MFVEDAPRRSIPSNSSFLAVTRPDGGVSPRIALPVCDLPDPLSPTIPSRSRPSVKDTSRTTRTGPSRDGKATFSPSTSSISVMSHPSDLAHRAGRPPAG